MNPRFQRFISYYKPYKKLFAAVIFCAMLVAVSSLVFPLLVRNITKNLDTLSIEGNYSTVGSNVIVMLALILLQAVCMYIYDYRGHRMGAMMERDMRAELFAHYEKLSFSFHDEHKPGQLMARLTNDLLNLAELAHHGPENLFIHGLKFLGAAVILIAINPRLALISLAFLPVILLFTMTLGRRMYRAMTKNLEVIGDVNSQVEENLSGIRVVKSFANERMENERFAQENNRFLASRSGIYRIESQFWVGITVLSQLITVSVVAFGAIGVANATLDLADLLVFVLYVNYLVEPISSLAFMIEQYQQGLAGFNRFIEIIDTQPDVRDAESAVPLKNVKGKVRFIDASFRYREDLKDVLAHLSLTVRAGETVALVGYSGVGKTTLCSLIPRFYDLTGGDITIDGQSIGGVTLESLRKAIGVVQQDTYLFSGSVYDNIRYGKPGATDDEVKKAALAANADEFIQTLPDGYETDIGHRGVKLSGGQRQRISIARAFLKNPPILIMDEATSSLDNESERKVQASLEVLAKDRTTFVIAHRLSTVKNADRIIVLSERGIAEQGTHEELMRSGGQYANLYGEELAI